MKELIVIISFAYIISGVVDLIAFLPTIKDLYYSKKESANILSYIIWTSVGFVSLLYSLFVLKDLFFRIVSAINFSACLTILILSIRLKKQKTKRL